MIREKEKYLQSSAIRARGGHKSCQKKPPVRFTGTSVFPWIVIDWNKLLTTSMIAQFLDVFHASLPARHTCSDLYQPRPS